MPPVFDWWSPCQLLTLHDGFKLREFYDDPYGKSPLAAFEADQPVDDHRNRRLWAYGMLHHLGYKGDDALLKDKNLNQRLDIERQLENDSVFHKVMARVAGIVGEVQGIDNAHILDSLLDIHALSTDLFESSDYAGPKRKEAIASCRDNTFWHTVLTEGRIYDLSKHDFTLRVEEKYTGATALFQPAS